MTGQYSIAKDNYVESLVQHPDYEPSYIQPLDDSILQDAFTLQPGVIDNVRVRISCCKHSLRSRFVRTVASHRSRAAGRKAQGQSLSSSLTYTKIEQTKTKKKKKRLRDSIDLSKSMAASQNGSGAATQGNTPALPDGVEPNKKKRKKVGRSVSNWTLANEPHRGEPVVRLRG